MKRSGRSSPPPRHRQPGPRAGARVGAAEFKARCLVLMDRVRERGVEYTVTKHGEPVAKLVPYRKRASKSFFGSMKGTVLAYDRPLDPIEGGYDIDRG